MSTAIHSATAPPFEPTPWRFSRDEYYQMLDVGLFQQQRVELIDGEIIPMSAQQNLHCASATLAADALRLAFGSGYWVRVQMSLDLTPYSVPDPDLAVVPGNPKGCTIANPTTALLVVEVSDSTLRFDSQDKASLYARAGIADYWVVNLVDRRLEIRRRPEPDGTSRFGYAHADVAHLLPAEFASPLAAPQARILVEDMLP